MKADKATVYRNNTTGKIARVHLSGHVSMRQAGLFVVGKRGEANLAHNTASFEHGAYLLNTQKLQQSKPAPTQPTTPSTNSNAVVITQDNSSQTNTSIKPKNAWGTASHIHRASNGVITLKHASYTTCPPISPTWKLSASKVILNRDTGIGTFKNAVLRLKNIPVFYWPYWRFPIDNRRKSGFLLPAFQSSKKKGYSISLPLYWNMAPNYDALFTSNYFTKRGYQLNTLFRYITKNSLGSLYVSGMPNDKGFQDFKNDTYAKFPGTVPALYAPYINKLHDYGDSRGYFSYQDQWSVYPDQDNNNQNSINKNNITPIWQSNIVLQYTSDPYYFNDYGDSYDMVSSNQLINKIDLAHNGLHWDFYSALEAYQTLHQINQAGSLTFNQYRRLPELDASAQYPNFWRQLDFNLNMQYVYFDYSSSFTPETFQLPIGQRLHIRPGISRALRWQSGYVTPSLYLDNTDYDSELAAPTAGSTRPSFTASRNLPIFDVDSGLYFDRNFHWHKQRYVQTLEPRIFYLYIPYTNQDHYPNFDTQLLPFSYNQSFNLNRFTGFDRLDNANQFSLGLSSSILSGFDNRQILEADLGVIYYLQRPKVCIDRVTYLPSASGTSIQENPNCNNQSNSDISPITGQLSFSPTSNWTTSGDAAWDTSNNELNNASANLTYTNNDNHVVTVGYTYVHNIDGIPVDSLGLSTATYLVHVGSAWTIGSKWGVFGYLDYNFALKRPNSYYAGVQYDTCCWTLRFIAQRLFQGIVAGSTAGNITNQYQTFYSVQLQLKGLVGNGNSGRAAGLLSSTLPGYRDPFEQPTL